MSAGAQTGIVQHITKLSSGFCTFPIANRIGICYNVGYIMKMHTCTPARSLSRKMHPMAPQTIGKCKY